MSRVIVALTLGAALGLGLYLGLRRDPEPVALTPASPAAAEEPRTTAGEKVFVDRGHPGVVVAVRRGQALEPNARVELFRAEHELASGAHAWRPAGVEQTAPDGRATFPALATLHLLVVTASDGARATKVFDVSRAGDATWVEVELGPTQRLRGQVLDRQTHQPVPGALVVAEPSSERSVVVGETRADSFGKFELIVPSAPDWRVVASAAGWLEASAPATPSEPLELLLERGVILEGRVSQPGGEPCDGARVRLAPGDVRETQTDHDGRFTARVPRGPVSAHATARDGRQALGRVVSRPDDERVRLELVVSAGSALEGRVVSSGDAVAGAAVSVLAEPDNLEVAAFETGGDGRFAARALPAGRYLVRAAKGRARRTTIVGLELPRVEPVELVLPGAARLTGVVFDPQRHPSANATVHVSWPEQLQEPARAAQTDEDGRFELDELLSAQLTVTATAGDLVSEEQLHWVGPDAVTEISIQLDARGTLIGRVITPEGQRPVERVLVYPEGTRAGHGVDVRDGGFKVELMPGSYGIAPLLEHAVMDTTAVEVRANEVTEVTITASRLDNRRDAMHPELGSGLSFENSPGGVRVDFLMSGCPAATAGVQVGDLVVSIDGEPTRDARDAFARVRRPSGAELSLVVRREGRDLPLTIK